MFSLPRVLMSRQELRTSDPKMKLQCLIMEGSSSRIEPFADLVGIDPHKKVNSLTKEERARILYTLKHIEIPLYRFRPIEEAIITSGGIDVKEITPKSM